MKKTSHLALNGIIAALYVALTIIPALIPSVGTFLYGAVQFRISEALCVLPFFLGFSHWGLFLGCIIANYIGLSLGLTMPIDILVGSLTTLLAAYMTTKIRHKWLVPIPTIVLNAVVIGAMLAYLFAIDGNTFMVTFITYAVSVGFGELVVCYGLGMPLIYVLEKRVFILEEFKKYIS